MTQAPFEAVLLYAPVNTMTDYFDKAIEFDSLYKAMKRCCRNLRWKDSVTGYEGNGLRNTYKLRQELLNGTYKISKYQRFVIHEPKTREIIATRFRDRQFQMALCMSGLYDDLVEHLIRDNPACQADRGTDYTLNRMTAHLRKYALKHGNDGWVLKCDIRHFFPETRHSVAKAVIKKRVKDERVQNAICNIIDSFGDEKGIALGSQISQLIELAVLDDLDHYIKERLRIKHYVRYMDDMILVHESKEYLIFCLDKITEALNNLGFELNTKTQVYPIKQGVKLMNWRFVITSTKAIKRFMIAAKMGRQRRKLRNIYCREIKGELAQGTAQTSLNSWLSNAKRGDTFYKRQRMIHYFYQLQGRLRNER